MSAITNRKAYFDYEILETLTVGVLLTGSEVKSVRNGQIQLVDSFIRIDNGEMYLWNCDIPKYSFSSDKNYDSYRSRKLLAKKSEIFRLISKMKQGRLTLIPLKVYNKSRTIKIEIGLARGKKRYEKKLREKEREQKIELHREKRNFML